MIRAAALHVKSLCDDGSIHLQRESLNQVLRNDFTIVSIETMMKQLNHVLDHFDDASNCHHFAMIMMWHSVHYSLLSLLCDIHKRIAWIL